MKRKYSGGYLANKKFAHTPKTLPAELANKIFGYYKGGLQSRMARPIARAVGRRVAAAAGGSLIRRGLASAGAVVPYIGPALQAAQIGYEGYKAYMSYQKQKEVARNKPFSGMSSGTYSGKFKKTSSRVGPYQKKKEVTQALGFVINKETYGKIADADCVYLGHSTYDITLISRCIAASLLRKLFKIAGYNVTSPDETLSLESYTAGAGSSAGFILKWTILRNDGTIETFTYLLPVAATLNNVVAGSGFETRITQMMENAGGGRPDFGLFENLWLYRDTTNEHMLVAHIALKNEIVSVWAKSSMTIQNRTKSADSGSADTDQVDTVPLKGLRYKFRGGVMVHKQQDNYRLSSSFRNGLVLHRAAELNPAQAFKEPPAAKHWSNCQGSSFERLEPGHIKKGVVYFKKSGYLNSLLNQMVAKMGTNGVNITYAPGSSEMYAFEEVVNTGSNNLLTLQYEREYTVGCITKKGKLPVCLAPFEEENINNLPP